MRRLVRWAMCGALVVSPVAAQEPTRPSLPAGADTNDWTSYYSYGLLKVTQDPRAAGAAFYWASRLDPTVPEPLYARWVAFWGADPDRLIRYARGDRGVEASRDVQANDSLMARAMLRDPFFHRGLEFRVFEKAVTGRTSSVWVGIDSKDALTRAWSAYLRGEMRLAATELGKALADRRTGSDTTVARLLLARVLYLSSAYDSAASEMSRVVEGMRAKEKKKLGFYYQSKAHLEYAVGLAYARAGEHEKARDAYSRALTEDLSFFMAHARLAEEAMALGDTAGALLEHGLAVQISERDVYARYAYGTALLQARQYRDAVEQLRRAVELEPWFAASYAKLALAQELLGQYPDAVTHYKRFVELAPRTADDQITFARSRIEELQGLPAITLGESQ